MECKIVDCKWKGVMYAVLLRRFYNVDEQGNEAPTPEAWVSIEFWGHLFYDLQINFSNTAMAKNYIRDFSQDAATAFVKEMIG